MMDEYLWMSSYHNQDVDGDRPCGRTWRNVQSSPAPFGEYKRGNEDGANAAIDRIAMPLD